MAADSSGTGSPASAASPGGLPSPAAPPKSQWPIPNVPLIDRPRSGSAPASLLRPPLPVCKRVLVVDDEPAILTLAVRILSTENYAIRSADSGASALRLLDEPGSPGVELLVTDLIMPGMNGRDLAAQVRARHPSVRVLYQTGFADELFNGFVELADGESFLEKPFTAEGLLQATRLLMLGYIASSDVPPDARDQKPHWADVWRERVFRFLKGPEPKRRKPRREAR